MWNRQQENSPGQRQQQPAQPHPVAAPVAAPPPAPRPADPPRPMATIGRAVSIRGDIISHEDLMIDGDLDGKIMADQHRLTVGPNGKVRADIKAREVTIQGSVEGKVEATEKIIIRKDGTLVGDVKMAGIVIEDGAYFKGSIDITRPSPNKVQEKVQAAGSTAA